MTFIRFELLIISCHFLLVVTISVSFNATTYGVSEDTGSLQPVLVLSNPSSTDITIQVTDNEDTATSTYVSHTVYIKFSL